jgi:ribonucleotide monophosphatase NagD (HAD superfamily)
MKHGLMIDMDGVIYAGDELIKVPMNLLNAC